MKSLMKISRVLLTLKNSLSWANISSTQSVRTRKKCLNRSNILIMMNLSLLGEGTGRVKVLLIPGLRSKKSILKRIFISKT